MTAALIETAVRRSSHFSAEDLLIDPAAATAAICAALRRQVGTVLRRKGAVLGLSGGVDSSVVAALCVRALGASRVLGILMPEDDSDPDSLRLGSEVAQRLGIDTVIENIGPILDAAGCYWRRDECIRTVFPDYGAGCRMKIILRRGGAGMGYNLPYLVVSTPGRGERKARLTPQIHQGIVAATNMKQRTRKQLEYYHADRLQYAVAGTPNRLEYDQGFFVKNGDGAADFKPIAHLYKCQVYQLAAHLGLPDEIRLRPPTTDTYSLAQTQEEFYFGVPLRVLDVCLYALEQGVPAEEAAPVAGISTAQAQAVFDDIESKRRSTRYLHEAPLLIGES